MSKFPQVGFGGYSIYEILEYTKGFELFRFMADGREGLAELSFEAVFETEAEMLDFIDRSKEIWDSMPGKKSDYKWSISPILNEGFTIHCRFILLQERYEEQDFDFGRAFESKLKNLVKDKSLRINDPRGFSGCGFDRKKYE